MRLRPTLLISAGCMLLVGLTLAVASLFFVPSSTTSTATPVYSYTIEPGAIFNMPTGIKSAHMNVRLKPGWEIESFRIKSVSLKRGDEVKPVKVAGSLRALPWDSSVEFLLRWETNAEGAEETSADSIPYLLVIEYESKAKTGLFGYRTESRSSRTVFEVAEDRLIPFTP